MKSNSHAGSHIARVTGKSLTPKKKRMLRISFNGTLDEVNTLIEQYEQDGYKIREKREHSFIPGLTVVVMTKYQR